MRIYITGDGRSGTTWFAMMVASNEKLPYFHEPFLRKQNADPFGLIKKKEVDPPYVPDRKYIFDYLSKGIKTIPNFVIKDFAGLYYTKNLQNELGFKIINVIRHPAPWTMSAVKLGWGVGFYDFIGIPTVMDAVRPYLDHIYSRVDRYWITWMSWAIRYMTLRKSGVGDWVTHEELCINTKKSFEKIGLKFNMYGQQFYNGHNVGDKPGPKTKKRITEEEPYKWFGKFDKFDEMRKALEPFKVEEWGHWGEEFWRG